MKHNTYLLSIAAAIVIIASCNTLDYKKTKTGLLYKIISSATSKDSVAKEGDYLKFHYISKLNDSILYNSYGKMPGYFKVSSQAQGGEYNPVEIFGMLKKGDSAVTVQLVDTFLKRGLQNDLNLAFQLRV